MIHMLDMREIYDTIPAGIEAAFYCFSSSVRDKGTSRYPFFNKSNPVGILDRSNKVNILFGKRFPETAAF